MNVAKTFIWRYLVTIKIHCTMFCIFFKVSVGSPFKMAAVTKNINFFNCPLLLYYKLK